MCGEASQVIRLAAQIRMTALGTKATLGVQQPSQVTRSIVFLSPAYSTFAFII
jgi:hypothetical protein